MKKKLIEYKKILLDIKRLIIIDYIERENEKKFGNIAIHGKNKVKIKSRF